MRVLNIGAGVADRLQWNLDGGGETAMKFRWGWGRDNIEESLAVLSR